MFALWLSLLGFAWHVQLKAVKALFLNRKVPRETIGRFCLFLEYNCLSTLAIYRSNITLLIKDYPASPGFARLSNIICQTFFQRCAWNLVAEISWMAGFILSRESYWWGDGGHALARVPHLLCFNFAHSALSLKSNGEGSFFLEREREERAGEGKRKREGERDG